MFKSLTSNWRLRSVELRFRAQRLSSMTQEHPFSRMARLVYDSTGEGARALHRAAKAIMAPKPPFSCPQVSARRVKPLASLAPRPRASRRRRPLSTRHRRQQHRHRRHHGRRRRRQHRLFSPSSSFSASASFRVSCFSANLPLSQNLISSNHGESFFERCGWNAGRPRADCACAAAAPCG